MSKKEQEIHRTLEIIKSGYAGVQSGTGTIVNRREYPDAIPVQENEMFNCPKPKEIQTTDDDGILDMFD